MDAETARQERIMGIRRIVRQQKEITGRIPSAWEIPPPANLRCVREVRHELRDTGTNPVR